VPYHPFGSLQKFLSICVLFIFSVSTNAPIAAVRISHRSIFAVFFLRDRHLSFQEHIRAITFCLKAISSGYAGV